MHARPLNATAASLLGFLHSGPLSGWDLLVTARTVIGQFWSITQSQVYRELAAMEGSGLIQARQSGPRDRRPYQLTDAGRGAFAAWISREPGPEQIRYPLLLTISFGAHLPAETLSRFVAAHRAAHADRLGEYEGAREAAHDARDADPFALATLEFGIRYERAVLEWFDTLPEEIAGSRTGASGRTDGGARVSVTPAPELTDRHARTHGSPGSAGGWPR
jgi:DNA-binding PadR family transcriptional regulator